MLHTEILGKMLIKGAHSTNLRKIYKLYVGNEAITGKLSPIIMTKAPLPSE